MLDTLADAGIDARLFLGGRLSVEHALATSLGYVSAEHASQMLAASDVFVLPLADGVSGRRSSAVSALAVGATVVTTAGPDTDADLFGAEGVAMSPAGDSQAFAELVLNLARNPENRSNVQAAGKRLFAEKFAWPVVAGLWERLLSGVSRKDNVQAQGADSR
ncbi:glycosyltransferase [Pseudarthrobacter sp. MDT1-22]